MVNQRKNLGEDRKLRVVKELKCKNCLIYSCKIRQLNRIKEEEWEMMEE